MYEGTGRNERVSTQSGVVRKTNSAILPLGPVIDCNWHGGGSGDGSAGGGNAVRHDRRVNIETRGLCESVHSIGHTNGWQ